MIKGSDLKLLGIVKPFDDVAKRAVRIRDMKICGPIMP